MAPRGRWIPKEDFCAHSIFSFYLNAHEADQRYEDVDPWMGEDVLLVNPVGHEDPIRRCATALPDNPKIQFLKNLGVKRVHEKLIVD